jgi:hypothetical protein
MPPTIISPGTLRELHRLHKQLNDLRDRLTRGPRQVQAHQGNVARTEQELEKTRDDTRAAKIATDQKQLQLKTCEAKIKDLKEKLRTCGTNREYQALLEQIAADDMAKSVLEDEILEALGKIEELVAATQKCEQNVAKAKEELAKTEQQVSQQAAMFQADLERLQAELHRIEENLPSDFREIYLRTIRSKGSDAMAQVDGDFCSGCCQAIPPNRISQLRLSQAVLCSSCGRLLYLPEERLRPAPPS